jgi:hypothetical protein
MRWRVRLERGEYRDFPPMLRMDGAPKSVVVISHPFFAWIGHPSLWLIEDQVRFWPVVVFRAIAV